MRDAAAKYLRFDGSGDRSGSLTEACGAYILDVLDARAEEYWELVPHEQFEEFCTDWLIPDVANKTIEKVRYSGWEQHCRPQEEEEIRADLISYLMPYLSVTLAELVANEPDLALPQEHQPSLEDEDRVPGRRGQRLVAKPHVLGQQAEPLSASSASRKVDPVASERRAKVDAYRQEVLDKTRKNITRKDILLGRQAVPLDGLSVVLWHALALVVHHAEDELGIGISLLGGHPIPLGRFGVVLRDTLALVVDHAEVELSLGISLLGGLDQIVKRRPSLFLAPRR